MSQVEATQTISARAWLIVITVMLIAILEVLDSTVVNVALTDMMATLGANADQITWILTSYVVASAIMIPLTGFLSDRVGMKQLLITNIIGFLTFSCLCGLTSSLSSMVIFRLLQGAFGAALIPLSQSILRQSFPLNQQGKAMAIWGMGIMVAPVMGPTLGGYIVAFTTWRWIFYMNVPFCLIGAVMAWIFIEKTPSQSRPFDWEGIGFMILGIGCLQLFLDQGNTLDWLQSPLIVALLALCLIGLTFFIIHSLKVPEPAVKLRLFRNRNFALCTLIFGIFAGCIFGTLTLQPIMLQTLFNYDAVHAGLAVAPMGIFSAIAMAISAAVMKRVSAKYIISAGLVCMSAGATMLAHLSLSASFTVVMRDNLPFGFGLGLLMVPLSTFALATLKTSEITDGSGLFSYGRMLGSSIGISVLSTLVSRLSQINWNQMRGSLSQFNPNVQQWSQQQNLSLQDPSTLSQLQTTLLQQSSLQAYIDAYHCVAIAFLCVIPLALLTKHVDLNSAGPVTH